ncbi:ATP-binding protein [Amycolatopsis sp. NPDC051903]|uniref:ATP-binding protein n=1 Tax=Amycolatopsis sp. NPDC051903 TaxID=3363936 RepID=UPI0037B8A26B
MTAALIGREHPASVLRAELARAMASHGGLVLVTGEAGIGKTTLVSGLADEARERGALVLTGTCWESGSAPGYWPWVQVVRALRRAAEPHEWAAADSATLSALLGESPEPGDVFRLHDAVTSALVTLAHDRPVVVVLDDLHWADPSSLRLLDFAARHTWFERLLLIGTYRDVEVDAADHPLHPLVLPLVAKATTVTLTGLAPAEVAELMVRTAGTDPGVELAADVHRRTGGNPFFVEQTARLWRSGSPVSAVAPGVADALQRRLSLLPAPVADLLTDASVLGREFSLRLLATVAGAPVPQVDHLLAQAVAARLVVSLGEGRFAFAHDLVRESRYADLRPEDAQRRHAAASRADPSLVGPAERARHAYAAGPLVDAARTVELLLAAARDASARLAIEESVGHLRRALELAPTGRTRAVVALELGTILWRFDEKDAAWEHFEAAVAEVRELDDAELIARAGLTLVRADPGGVRHELIADLLLEAHRRLCGGTPGEQLSLDRVTLELTARAAMLARDDKDDHALAFSLWARHDAIWGPGSGAERERLTDELAAIAKRTGDRENEYFASSLKWVALLEQGDPRYLDQFRSFQSLTAEIGLRGAELAAMIDRSIIQCLHGRFAEGEATLEESLAVYTGGNEREFGFMADQLRWSALLLQGRFAELAELPGRMAAAGHEHPGLLRALAAAHAGDAAATRERMADAAAEAPYSREFTPLWLRCQVQAAAVLADRPAAESLLAELSPYSGEWLVSLYGCDLSGPVDLWTGLLAHTLGEHDRAVELLTAAAQSADRLRARPWSIEARTHLASALHARGDTDRAATLFAEVTAEAAEIGMHHIADRARSARTEALPANEFRRTDAVWSLRYAGVAVHVPDTKGLRDLHFLLGRPGTEVPATTLLDPAAGPTTIAAASYTGDPVLDDTAKAAYRHRLTELDSAIDHATTLADDTRAAALDEERAALLTELRRSSGLAGRTRRLGDHSERARKAVTARIRDTLRKLAEQHPTLAAHLQETITTGSSCSYAPQDSITWRL